MGWNNCKNAKTCGHTICFEKACMNYAPKEKNKQTNGDRIREMSDEELAYILYKFAHSNNKPLNKENLFGWLQQPADKEV